MPSAVSDMAVTTAGASIAIAVLTNDSGDGLGLAGFTQPNRGSVAIGADNTLVYTPEADFLGVDTFTYTVIDEIDGTAQGQVTVEVVPPNDAPNAVAESIEIPQNQQAIIPVLANDTDPDGDRLALAAITMPAFGVVEVIEGQQIRYTPQPEFVGMDSFSYTVTDQRGGFDGAQVNITVRGNSAKPMVINDLVTVAVGDTVQISPLANDSDPEGGQLELIAFTLPAIGQLALRTDRESFDFTPSQPGAVSFTYTVRDSRGTLANGTVAIEVTSANAPPLVQDDSVETDQDTPVDIDVLANDTDEDGDSLAIVALGLPSFGSVQLNSDNKLTYTPLPGISGEDEFVYTVRDIEGETNVGRVSVTIRDTGARFANGRALRRCIVVPPQTDHSETATNFVLFVSLQDGELRSSANGGRMASDQAFDLRFELPDATPLSHHTEKYDPLNGELLVWIRIPAWDLGTRLEVLMYFDDPTVSVDSSNESATWSGYAARWRSTDGVDSTGNGHNLTPENVGAGELVGPAGDYSGSSVMSLADASFQAGLSEFTIQAVVKADAAILGQDVGIVTEGEITGSSTPAGITLQYLSQTSSSGTQNVVHFKARCADGNAFTISSADRHTTEKQILHGTWRAGEVPTLFVDGALEYSSATSDPRSGPTLAAGPLFVGTGPLNSASGAWQGLIDEVRFSNRALSEQFVAAEAHNLADPVLFYGVGASEKPNGTQMAPIAVPFRVATPSAVSINIDVLAEAVDKDSSGDLVLQAVTQPSKGSTSIVGGLVRYVPAAGFSGRDRFTYTIGDGSSSSTASIEVIVEAVVEPPMPTNPILPNGKRVLLMDQAPVRILSATPANIQTVINNARAGDRVELANGTYGGFTVTSPGNESAPIVIAAANPRRAVLTSQVTVRAPWLRFDGLRIVNGGNFEVYSPSSNLRFDRCEFEDHTDSGIRLRGGVQNVRMSRCVGRNGRNYAIYCDLDGLSDAQSPKFVHIDHCYFTGYNTSPCIRLGDTSFPLRMYELFAVMEYNLFDTNTGHRELIVGKSSQNWVRYNTFVGGSRGDISIRMGSYYRIYGNYMVGAGGITVVAEGNEVYNNYVTGGDYGIWLMSGDTVWDRETTQRPIYCASERNTIANNTIIQTSGMSSGIRVGGGWPGPQEQTNFKATENDIVNNLIYRVSGSSPLIDMRAQESNRFANNLVSASTGFTAGGVTVADPQMSLVDGVYRPSASSPARGRGQMIFDFGETNLTITTDIDGHNRGGTFDIGADQINSGSPIFSKLSLSDVGFDADDPYAA